MMDSFKPWPMWAVYFRQGLRSVPDGTWYVWEYTLSHTRSGSIQKFGDNWGPNKYRQLRRVGAIKCLRSAVVPMDTLVSADTLLALRQLEKTLGDN